MVKNKLRSEYDQFRKDATWFEFAFWLAGWGLLVYALIVSARKGMPEQTILVIKAQSTAAFLIPVFHLLPRKVFLARIPYRAQTWVLVNVLAAAFVGKFMNIYTVIPKYDFYLHAFGCIFCVFAGYELSKGIRKNSEEPLPPVIGAICGFGLSFFAAVAWEIFEFICDQFFNGDTQNWGFNPGQDFLSVFPTDPRRFALMDTMTDLISGTVGSFIGGVILFVSLCLVYRKSKLKLVEKNKKQKGILPAADIQQVV